MPAPTPPFSVELRHRREALGLTQLDAASRLGITARTLQRYENGESAPARSERKAEFLDRLAETTTRPARHQRTQAVAAPVAFDADNHDAHALVSIPGGGSAGAGAGRTNDGEAVEQVLISRSEVERVTGLLGRLLDGLEWVLVVGDSMQPELRAGERVYYVAGHPLNDAGIYVLEMDGERIVKMVQRLAGGVLDLIPVNRAYATERLVPIREADTANTFRSELTGQTCSLRVIGKVVFNLQPR